MMPNYSRPTRLEYTASTPLVCLEMRSVRCPGLTVQKTNACGNVTCFGFSPTCLATLHSCKVLVFNADRGWSYLLYQKYRTKHTSHVLRSFVGMSTRISNGATSILWLQEIFRVQSQTTPRRSELFSSTLAHKFLTPIPVPSLLRNTQSVYSEDFFLHFMQSVFVCLLFLQTIARIISFSVFDMSILCTHARF